MSETFISGDQGGVVLPSSHYMKVMKWSQKTSMKTKEISCYGGGRFEQHRGGLVGGSGTIIGLLRTGGGAGNAPGAASMEPDGAALTLGAAGNTCTYTGTALFTQATINHDVSDPAVPISWDFKWTGTIVEAWG